MAMKFHAHMGDGLAPIECTGARRFSAYVNNVRFWFAVHRPVGQPNAPTLAVSHWESGKSVCQIGATSILAGVGMNWAALARAEIRRTCERAGEQRVYDVLRAAERGNK